MSLTEPTWQQLCNQIPLTIEQPLQESPLNVALLNQLGVLSLTGKDAASFLQSQLTNDANSISRERGQISGYCNHKGRLLGLFQLIADQDGYIAITPSDLLASLSKRLQMFVMRSAVTLEDQSDSLAIAGLWGNEAVNWLTVSGYLPTKELYSCQQIAQHPETTLIRQPGENAFLLVGPKQQLANLLLNPAAPKLTFQHENEWKIQTVTQGQPTIGNANADTFIPQMINLDLINGVNFQKGCYPGQEIVARTRYLGKLKKRMMLFEAESQPTDSQPTPGDPVMTEGNAQSVGTLVDVAISGVNQFKLLAVVRIDALSKPLTTSNLPLTCLALPYEIITEAEAD